MEACLSAVNIKSYSAWIKSGDDQTYMDPDFTHDGFDHQILMVPLEKDTIWLECTSNYNEFGHLGSFTENRYALVLTENGGKLVKTPKGKATDNSLLSRTDIKIANDATAEVNAQFLATGEYKYMLVNVSRETGDYHKQFAVNFFSIPNPEEFTMKFGTKPIQPFPCDMQLLLDKIQEFKAGNKMFIRSRMYKMWQTKLDPVDKRTNDYFLSHPLQKTDTTVFHLPEGFTVESLPKNNDISFPLGIYESHYWFDEKTRTIFSTARLIITSYKIESSMYDQARVFFDQVIADGNQKIICKTLE